MAGATHGQRGRAKRQRRVLVVNGPNLNLLGEREPEHYGRATLAAILDDLRRRAATRGVVVSDYQSNSEGELVTRVQAARGVFDGIIINAGAYTHTSLALRDALLAAEVPAVEVHLSNLYRREQFRQHSFTAAACIGYLAGFGPAVYGLGLEALLAHLDARAAAGGAAREEVPA